MSSSEQRQKQFDLHRNKANTTRTSNNSGEKNVSPKSCKLQTSLEMQQPNVHRRAAGSNWLAATASGSENKVQVAKATEEGSAPESEPLTKSARTRQRKMAQRNRYLSMDCEMVGVGHNGQEDMLARVSIVNSVGHVLMDKYVKPRQTVTDYRTSVSGIRPHDIENAEDFATVQDEVVKLLHGKILVGHALRHDLAVLNIKHPFEHIRDTSRYKPLCKLVSNGHTPSLKRLTMAVLGQEIQTGEHNSVEDARSAMGIYNRIAADWEKHLEKKQLQQQRF
ncbi:GL25291 [Drosophila persimilis]|uniref:RNA exonuclease 4 n=1 Tax=Drosophila persimilis TaxID=7234 RepID=B4GRZ6_DROPE|nr:RNA exonuclease 4 [Drosophila persimilis]EDW40531.1 GL25291 [Drosophila persimilis]